MPPIHLVAKGEGRFDVLDGQQRLTAIRDFKRGLFVVDGFVEPVAPEFGRLDGLRFAQLPEGIQEEFEAFAVRVFELHDYTPDEPHELFFRLNQPVVLTEAEKRNAFIGAARNQVKELAEWGFDNGMTPDRLGFSNARMAHHDLLARFLLTIEQGKLTEKVTALRVTARYREKEPFTQEVIKVAHDALKGFLAIPYLEHRSTRTKPNKATVHTWLCMTAKLVTEDCLDELYGPLSEAIELVETWRFTRQSRSQLEDGLLNVFQDRATARVADVTSVLLRDIVGWMLLYKNSTSDTDFPGFLRPLPNLWDDIRNASDIERFLNSYSTSSRWGDVGWL